MSQNQQTTFATYNARRLSQKHLAAWSETGEAQQQELKNILSAVIRTVRLGHSPSKAIKETQKRLEIFFARNEVRGNVQLINQRHIHVRLAFPVNTDDKLTFCLLDGTINARSGATKLELKNPIQLSLHALQRLFERLEQPDESAVLDEIYSCMAYASHWHSGGVEAKARCWPLISANGFFVATTAPESTGTSTIITWIKQAGSGRKWGLPLQALCALKKDNPSKLESLEFSREFIRSFPWMRYEHAPGDDYFTQAEAQRDMEISLPEEEGKDVGENRVVETNWQEKEKIKLSASYIPGLNYENNPPPFGFRTEHLGVAVHLDSEGIVVGLKNGWVGKIPKKSLLRGYELIPEFRPPSIGDDVVVVIHKIKHFISEGAYSISLDPKEVSIANWQEIEKNNPIGSITRAKVVEKFKDEFVLTTADGLRGSILAANVQNFLKITNYEGSVFNLWIDVQVIGYKPEKKCLSFSLLSELQDKSEHPSASFEVGDRVWGTCKESKLNFSVIELPFGELGILHLFNHWGKHLPATGDKIELSIIYKDQEHFNFVLATDPPAHIDRVFPPVIGTDNLWDEFMDRFRVGDALDVQVLFWAEDKQCFVVNTGLGVAGMLSPNELDWGILDREVQKKLVNQGDVLEVLIKKIDPTKRRFSVSKKRFDSQLTYEKSKSLNIGDMVEGTVVTVQDYGYFIWLPAVKVHGLLHVSNLCDGESFAVGDSIKVQVENVDYPTRRVSLASARLKQQSG